MIAGLLDCVRGKAGSEERGAGGEVGLVDDQRPTTNDQKDSKECSIFKGERGGGHGAASGSIYTAGIIDNPGKHVHSGVMKKANISYTRNHLSEMISQVREGETILIVDRHRPVARLEPVGGSASRDVPWQADLVRRGLIRSARARLDVKALGALRMAVPNEDADILAALLDEREDGR